MRRTILAFMAAAALWPATTTAMVNGAIPADSDARFDAVGALAVTWRLGLDPTNPDPATGDHNWYCAATLTRPSTIHTAKHCVDAYGASAAHAVRFRRALDGSVGTIEAGVGSFFHAYVSSWSFPGDDVAIGTLAAPVTHIAPIPVLYEDAADVYVTAPLILAGWGREGPGQGVGQLARLRTCETHASGVGIFGIAFPSAWDGQRDPCGPNNSDSGGAVLVWHVASGGSESLELRYVGIVAGYGLAWRMSGYAPCDCGYAPAAPIGTVGALRAALSTFRPDVALSIAVGRGFKAAPVRLVADGTGGVVAQETTRAEAAPGNYLRRVGELLAALAPYEDGDAFRLAIGGNLTPVVARLDVRDMSLDDRADWHDAHVDDVRPHEDVAVLSELVASSDRRR